MEDDKKDRFDLNDEKITTEIKLDIPSMSDIVSGRPFPEGKINPKKRWFFQALLALSVICLIAMTISAISLLFR